MKKITIIAIAIIALLLIAGVIYVTIKNNRENVSANESFTPTNIIPLSQAEELIKSGKVLGIYPPKFYHEGYSLLRLKNGTELTVKEDISGLAMENNVSVAI